MRRWGWGDLLGVYQAELDDEPNLKNYLRITPDEIEKYLRDVFSTLHGTGTPEISLFRGAPTLYSD